MEGPVAATEAYPMDRRRFLETTFASGLTLSGSACARAPRASAPPLTSPELDAKLTRLDETLARLDHDRTTRWYMAKRKAEFEAAMAGDRGDREYREAQRTRERLAHEGELLRSSMRVALLVSTVGELPEQNHSDERVVERVVGMADEADYALFGTLERLRNLDQSELDELDAELTADAAPGMDVAAQLDEISAELGVPTRRRLHLRRMAKHIDWRLERERFSTIVSETLSKVDRMLESLARATTEPPAPLALAGPNPEWVARTHEVVRFYAAPAPSDPADDAPAEPPPDAGSSSDVQTPSPSADPSTAAPSIEPPPPIEPPPSMSSDPTSGELPRADQAPPPPCELPTQMSNAAAQQQYLQKDRRLMGAGGGLLALGGVAIGVGLGVGFVTGGVGFFVLAGIGGVALTAGIILLIVGAVLTARAKRRAKR